MNWQILLGISIVFGSLVTIFQKMFLKEEVDPLAYAVVFQLLIAIIVGLAALFTNQLVIPNLSQLIGALVLQTVISSATWYFIFRALKETTASIFTIIFSVRIIVTITLATILFKEGLSVIQLVGALVVLGSVLVVSWKKEKISFGKGELLSLAAAAALGLSNIGDRYLLGYFQVLPYMALMTTLSAGLILVMSPKTIKKIRWFMEPTRLGKAFLIAVLNALAVAAFLGALQLTTNASQVVTLYLLTIILTVFLSVVFLKERGNLWQKLLGGGLSFIGAVLVAS